jgi:hypothetical protein
MVNAMITRMEEARESIELSNVEAILVAVGVTRRIAATVGIDVAPYPSPQRDALYDMIVATFVTALRADATEPPEVK